MKGADDVTFRRTATCPACSKELEVSRLVFLPDFECRHCGVGLKVSLTERIRCLFYKLSCSLIKHLQSGEQDISKLSSS